ncbi:hypothetical protein GGS21DRAFT_489313 [Xylaria nigripes]|nr:hypothetical protein GGS21DRAFT_489313 [Xylaria nigripes]
MPANVSWKEKLRVKFHRRGRATSPAPSAIQSMAKPAQLEPSIALSLSQGLWNTTYDSLGTSDAQLVTSYAEALIKFLEGKADEPCDASSLSKLKDPIKRQEYMRELVLNGQKKMSQLATVTTKVGEIADFILFFKPVVDQILQSLPQAAPAALPWAGVCLVLQYYALAEHLLSPKNIVADRNFKDVLCQLETNIIELYRTLLLYEMKSVCSYFRNQSLILLRSIFSFDDWEKDFKLVADAETTVCEHVTQFYQAETMAFLDDFLNTSEITRQLIAKIEFNLQDIISFQKNQQRDADVTACVRDLFVVDPTLDMERIEKKKDILLNDAYK